MNSSRERMVRGLFLILLTVPCLVGSSTITTSDAIDEQRFDQFQEISRDGWLPDKYSVFRSRSKMRVRNVSWTGMDGATHLLPLHR